MCLHSHEKEWTFEDIDQSGAKIEEGIMNPNINSQNVETVNHTRVCDIDDVSNNVSKWQFCMR